MYRGDGVGLRGGTFTTTGPDLVRFDLTGIEYTEDLAVSGSIAWDRTSGGVSADLTVTGVADGTLHLAWNDRQPVASATAEGTVSGDTVVATLAAP